MLATDAYAFLNIYEPLCAWATYRGVLVCAPDAPGFVSVWSAGLLRNDDPDRLAIEVAIENVRAENFPERISRLRGVFCFPDKESAMRARSWGTGRTHFDAEYLAELSLAEAGARRDRLDANWITHARRLEEEGDNWIRRYWAGDSYPQSEPIWEVLVDGRLIVIGTTIREMAYKEIKSEFPESLMFLEISRQTAWVGSDLGTICAFIHVDGNELSLDYCMNMLDAENPEFLAKLVALKKCGHPINWNDLEKHVNQDSFGRVPDFRPYSFRRLLR